MGGSELSATSPGFEDGHSLHDEADDFEDDLRAEMVRAGVISEW